MKTTSESEHTIGIDLGDAKHTVCVLDGDGEVIDRRTITNHRESLRRLAKRYPGARVAMEVGGHSPWTSRFLERLGISKTGNAYLRRLLVGAAQYMLGPFGAECDLRARGQRLAERGGKGAKNRAAVATARKLAVTMLAMWREKTDYEPLRTK